LDGVADQILALTGVRRGYGMVLGCGEGRLATALARRSELVLFGVGEDAGRLARARAALGRSGVYGTRITLRTAALAALPFPTSFANLIATDDPIPPDRLGEAVATVLPWLQPATGVACLGPFTPADRASAAARLVAALAGLNARANWVEAGGSVWLRVVRELPPDTGSWTHQYGDAGNTGNSREGLQGVASTDRLTVHWLGRPGADFGIDRNPRMPAPLAVNGRLFHQGLNRIVALDSYNGAILWSIEIPALRRVNLPRDAGNWCADRQRLFVAVGDRCWVLAAASGELTTTFQLPASDPGRTHDWGWIAASGEFLYGSSVKRGAAYTEFWGKASWYDGVAGPGTEKVCSDDVFALDAESGGRQWHYRGGVVLNSTLAIAGGRVLFVECRHPEVAALATGRIGSPRLWEQLYLVALDARTGARQWDRPLDIAREPVVFYLLSDGPRVFVMASAAGKYRLRAVRGVDGADLWQAVHDWPRDNHGGHLQHPVAVRDAVYLEPCGYDAATGRLLTRNVGRHGGCATYAATADALIYRGEGGRVSMWDIGRESTTGWDNLRPSCWLSTVPANGMVLSPEGGGGCSCGNWLETSIGFAPVARPAPPPNGR
jgi:SAM-dependent methyltransferase